MKFNYLQGNYLQNDLKTSRKDFPQLKTYAKKESQIIDRKGREAVPARIHIPKLVTHKTRGIPQLYRSSPESEVSEKPTLGFSTRGPNMESKPPRTSGLKLAVLMFGRGREGVESYQQLCS